ncbi:hypothetical protein CDAR_254001 [Caerostris darwini]|uniref:Uncharacterized protein n=1 Tax=Caerostris darwini TaxID=1538125 RepID=A0AAV4S536_9ARAC|nr:hypothetical protein CDAR_254001 [Caerostris darwini]
MHTFNRSASQGGGTHGANWRGCPRIPKPGQKSRVKSNTTKAPVPAKPKKQVPTRTHPTSFTSRPANANRAYSDALRQRNESRPRLSTDHSPGALTLS